MFLKIIAKGFITKKFSYLRDPWNVLDFGLVISSWIVILIQSEVQYSALRIVKILRPLRTINSMPGMSGLIATIWNSMPVMFDVGILFLFFLLLFGTIATQILMGALNKRCKYFDADS